MSAVTLLCDGCSIVALQLRRYCVTAVTHNLGLNCRRWRDVDNYEFVVNSWKTVRKATPMDDVGENTFPLVLYLAERCYLCKQETTQPVGGDTKHHETGWRKQL